jgi:esterase/lipase
VYDTVSREIGANIFYTRLTGHGIPWEELSKASLNGWINDAWEAYQIGKRIGNRVAVAATSMGATLGLWLASQDTPEIAALVFCSACAKPADPQDGRYQGSVAVGLYGHPRGHGEAAVHAAFFGAARVLPCDLPRRRATL